MNEFLFINEPEFICRIKGASGGAGLLGSWGSDGAIASPPDSGLDPALGTGARIGVVTTGQEQRLLATGEFARRSGLSLKALRIYDQNGLLKPAAVDPGSGRRGYAPDQIRPARLIGMLRGAGMSLADIGPLLDALASTDLVSADPDAATAPDAAAGRLDRYLAELERRHTSRRFLISHVRALLREEEAPMFPIQTRSVPAQLVMSIQRRLRAPQTDAFVAEAKAAFGQHLDGTRPAGPFTLIFHGIVDHESDGPIEAVLGCPPGTEPTDLIGIRTEPAHDEAFTTITKAQWDFPAILAAYDAVACAPEVAGRPRSPLSCREVYLADPAAVGPDGNVCDIAFPLG
jgi:DNA-binding transcriptional MerR regulator